MKKVLSKLNRIINEFNEEGLIAEGMALNLVFEKVAQQLVQPSDDDINSWSDDEINDEINEQGKKIQSNIRYLDRYKRDLERLMPVKQQIAELEHHIAEAEHELKQAEDFTNHLYNILEARPSQQR